MILVSAGAPLSFPLSTSPPLLTCGLDFLLDNAPYRKYEFVPDSSNEHY